MRKGNLYVIIKLQNGNNLFVFGYIGNARWGKFMRILYSSIVAMLITDFYIMIVMSPSSCLARR